ncbi:cytochrome P450 1A2 [Colletotrichum sojae]|uniref:Cytochrome P450 1A2 n=1 Tax=Colletotrichum sojae TaxID=2175907 RepID=A0A8H6MKR5_9PEZI|nr:cytochrome P450 1A2 [Colletotrichum sojae]
MLVASSPILVFQESPSQPIEFFAPGKPAQWPTLTLAKYQEYNDNEHKINPIFYGSNHFNLVDTTTRRETSILEAFLVSPTTAHARLLSHMSLSFPALEAAEGRPEVLGLTQDGMRALKLLQDNCANLTTLEFYVHEGNAFSLVGEPSGDLQSSCEALSQVDTQLKVIPSLKRIVIRYYYDRPNSGVMQLMQGFDWIVLMGDEGLA